jgi:Xaa-Pro aminopeptidase
MMLAAEKTRQATDILRELDLDLWLTFVRETALTRDPALDLILGVDLVWPSALMITRDGTRLAIVGRYDADNVRHTGAYDEVIGYDLGLRTPLRETIERFDPRAIAINTSENDAAADGLTHGLHALLLEYLTDTPYATRLVSAERLMAALRGRKTAAETARLRAAVAATETLIADVTAWLRPGLSEREIASYMTAWADRRGLSMGWDPAYCPAVNAGPESPVGHGAPGDLRVTRGWCLHTDVGVRRDGYTSDMQRMWYWLAPGETRAPDDVQRAFNTVRAAIEAARAVLRPGVQGWQVDEAARRVVVEAGYEEYLHATGHHLGRSVHDGATTLGPRWERYGHTPYGIVEAGNVFTLELGIMAPGRGYIGLEEDVVVTEHGAEYLGNPQTEITCL